MSEELVEVLRGQPEIAQTQVFTGYARVVPSLSQECDIETLSCPLYLTIETPWGPVRFTMPFMLLHGGGDVVIIGQKTMREKLNMDVMAQLKAYIPEAHRHQGGMEGTAYAVGETKVGAVLRVAMAFAAPGSGGDAPGDVDGEFTLTLLSQPPMVFQNSVVEMEDRVGALETAVDDVICYGLPPECAKVLRDIGYRTYLDVFRRALFVDPPARVKPMIVRLRPDA